MLVYQRVYQHYLLNISIIYDWTYGIMGCDDEPPHDSWSNSHLGCNILDLWFGNARWHSRSSHLKNRLLVLLQATMLRTKQKAKHMKLNIYIYILILPYTHCSSVTLGQHTWIPITLYLLFNPICNPGNLSLSPCWNNIRAGWEPPASARSRSTIVSYIFWKHHYGGFHKWG